jgi:geranylgeranyl reductase family protein
VVVERFDAVVVGAGPAGSTAAHLLADAGVSVLLIDRATFPRDKPCGGGLTMRAVKLLPCSVAAVVEERIDVVEVRRAYRRGFVRHPRAPLALMTQRRRLDAHLAERAAAAGAEFRDGIKITDVRSDALCIDGEEISTRALIVADGANGTTARALGLGGDVVHGVAYEGNAPYPSERYRGRMVLELGAVRGGYAWIFPKGDHVNVGVGGWADEGPQLREHLAQLCDAHGIDGAAVTNVRGHRLPMRRAGHRLARGSALLVGDAAGLVDPFSGDGMYEAFASARLAVAAVLDLLARRAVSLEAYAAAVDRRLGRLAAAGWGAKLAVDQFPRATFACARLPPTWRVVEKLLLGELAHPGAASGAERAAIHMIELLAQRSYARDRVAGRAPRRESTRPRALRRPRPANR